MMLGLGLPYNEETIVGELLPNGERSVYREVFDQQSWAELPKRVPWLRSHQRHASPLGWAQVDSRPGGLHVLIEPVAGSTAAADAVAEVRSGVLKGLSVGFWQNPEQDEIDTRDRRRLPLVRRRGATLREISLALEPAYAGAEITSVDADADAHRESEALLAPLRREQAAAAAERRREDARLMDWVGELAEPVRSSEPAAAAPPAGSLTRIGRQAFRVADGADPAYTVDQYLARVAEQINRRGRSLVGAELAELQRATGLHPVS